MTNLKCKPAKPFSWTDAIANFVLDKTIRHGPSSHHTTFPTLRILPQIFTEIADFCENVKKVSIWLNSRDGMTLSLLRVSETVVEQTNLNLTIPENSLLRWSLLLQPANISLDVRAGHLGKWVTCLCFSVCLIGSCLVASVLVFPEEQSCVASASLKISLS